MVKGIFEAYKECKIADKRYTYCHKISCQKHKECYAIFSETRRKSEEGNGIINKYKLRQINLKIKPSSPLLLSPIFQNLR